MLSIPNAFNVLVPLPADSDKVIAESLTAGLAIAFHNLPAPAREKISMLIREDANTDPRRTFLTVYPNFPRQRYDFETNVLYLEGDNFFSEDPATRANAFNTALAEILISELRASLTAERLAQCWNGDPRGPELLAFDMQMLSAELVEMTTTPAPVTP